MYDLIVIGDDLSSHIAAAVASRQNIKTVLLAESGLGETCTIGGFVFNLDSTPLAGFSENQICHSVLTKLGILPIEEQGDLLNPAYQIILPEHRLDFFNDKELLVQEMTREFPQLSGVINSFYNAVVKNSDIVGKWYQDHPFIQPKSIKDYFEFLKLIPRILKYKFYNTKFRWICSGNASFRKVMEAQQALLSFFLKDQDSIFSHFRYSAPLRGIYNFSHGKQTLLNSLINEITSSQGLYLANCEVSSVRKGKLIEVSYSNDNGDATKISADNLIVSTKWEKINLLFERKNQINIDDLIRPVKVSHNPFTIHLGIRQNSVPEKMVRHVAVITDVNKDIYDDNLIILELSLPDDEKTTSSGKCSLSATVFLHDDPMIWSNENLTATARSIVERLEFFLPFLKENIEVFDIKESINISRKQRNIVNPKYLLRNSFITGFAAKSNKTKFSNIFLTGASLLMDAGFDGEIISGVNAANCVADRRK
jgi:hypothetical protein